MIIDGVEIGEESPCRFVCEISNSHNGSLDRAFRMIEAAKESGCDFVKFQCFTPSELIALRGDGPAPEPWGSQGWTMRSLYEKAQTPLGWFPELVGKCREVGIAWFSSVFGSESLMQLEYVGCPAYKVARLDNQSGGLASLVKATGKPLIVSGCDPDRRDLRGFEYDSSIFLWCPEGYPQTRFRFDHIGIIDSYPFDWGYTGFSYHGIDPLPCIVAASLHAKIIEAHFQLDDEPSELEANVSLTASQFKKMIEDVRRVEEMVA